MEEEQRKIEETIEEYYNTFTKFKPSLVAPFNNIPIMFIEQGKVVVLNTWIGFWLVFKSLMASLKKQNYGSSTFTSKGVKFLNEKLNLALVDGIVSRYRTDGTEIESFSFTYVMRKVDDSWKIVVGIYP